MRIAPALSVLALAAFAALGAAAPAGTQPAWAEIKWPFPIDQWGIGKTFRCGAKDCGRGAEVYLRAKIGFCNCTTGIADDAELERVADFDLFGDRPVALGPGRAVTVRAMAGRSRLYSVAQASGKDTPILTIGLNHRCDAVIVTITVDRGSPADLEPAVLAFLGSDTVARWAHAALGP
jgi:hypothetical protein